MKDIFRLLVLMLVFAFSGCNNARIAEDISQTEANQIIALLARHGIYARSSKEDSGKAKYYVEIDNSLYTQAKSILVDNALPKGDKTSFEDLVQAKGLLPNSREIESLRLDHAMAVELEDALNSHPDISLAKVIVRAHTGTEDRAVSVILQEKSSRKVNTDEIKNIVFKTIPGVKPENLVITVSEELINQNSNVSLNQTGIIQKDGKEIAIPLTHFIFNWNVPEADYNSIVIVLIICLVVVGIIGWLVGYWFGYFKNSKIILENVLPDISSKNYRLDRPERMAERGTTNDI